MHLAATPGRLVDHMKQSPAFVRQQLSQIRQLVLDEADRMLSMAFAEDLDTILNVFERPDSDRKGQRKKKKKKKKLLEVVNTAEDPRPVIHTQTSNAVKYPHPQTHLYSATMTNDVAKLRRAALSSNACILRADTIVDPTTQVTDSCSQVRFPPGLIQYCLPLRLIDKPAILNWLLEETTLAKLNQVLPCTFTMKTMSCFSLRTIVFCKRCQEVRMVTAFLRECGHSVVGLTGRMKQIDRKQALADFLSENIRILVATDVASRGLDIPNVELVINFSVPLSEKTYRHRVGRTARAGRSGIAVTLVTRDVASVFLDLEAALAPHLPKTDGETQAVLPRWPIPLPQSSGKQGMVARRRLSDLAWARAGKAVRAEDIERKKALDGSFSDDNDDESDSSLHTTESLDSSDSEGSMHVDNLTNQSLTTKDATGSIPVVLNTSGTAGLDMARATWKSLNKEKRLKRQKREIASEEKRKASAVGWGLTPVDSLAVLEDADDVDHLRYEETLKTKYSKSTLHGIPQKKHVPRRPV